MAPILGPERETMIDLDTQDIDQLKKTLRKEAKTKRAEAYRLLPNAAEELCQKLFSTKHMATNAHVR